MRALFRFLLIGLAVLAAVAAAMIALTGNRPAELASVTGPFKTLDLTGLPPLEKLETAKGAPLALRRYGAPGAMAVIALHGSAGRSESLHPMARALANAAIAVYVPDMRGHGESAPLGDVAYPGQLDDDMRLLIAHVRNQNPGATVVVLGFSSGAGYALKFAGGKDGHLADGYFLIAPALGRAAPEKARAETWAGVKTTRIAALKALNALGIHALDGLEVISFATPDDPRFRPNGYSHRLLADLLPDDYTVSLRNLVRRAHLLLGGEDQLFDAATLRAAFLAARPDISTLELPGIDHAGLILNPVSHAAILSVLGGETVENRPSTDDDDTRAPLPDSYLPKPPAGTQPPDPQRSLRGVPPPPDGAPLMPKQ
jgi:pimeloyl-ACP methyl ester carboxylesterase